MCNGNCQTAEKMKAIEERLTRMEKLLARLESVLVSSKEEVDGEPVLISHTGGNRG